MKQLTRSEFNKNGTTYKSVTSPSNDEVTQITDIAVKNEHLAYSTDGSTFQQLTDEVQCVTSDTIYQSPNALPQSADNGTVYATLNNGELPISLYKYNGTAWVLLDQVRTGVLYYIKSTGLVYAFESTSPYWVATSYTNTSQLTNGANFVNKSYVDGLAQAGTDARQQIINDLQAETTARQNADTTLQNNINSKYTKPTGGIPASDLAQGVQDSLGLADSALQSINSSDVTNALGYTPYNATNPQGYTKVESSTTNGNIKINGSETTVYTLPSNIATDSDVATVQSNLDAEITARGNADTTLQNNINTINGKIPTAASTTNQLADKNFVNSSINAFAAYYITKNAAGDPFATKAELNAATTFYSGGAVRTPTTNDYCIVLADETKQSETGVDPTTRYSYQGSQWEYQYTVNDTPLTAAQLAALNSGITSSLVTQITTNAGNITSLQSSKQDALSTAQLNAVNSGITSTLVTQITTNQTDIAGKQDKIDSSHKLSTDLVDDTGTTNKFVTASDITNWNSKQNALTFDDTPTNGSNNPVKSGGIYTELAGKQNTLVAGTNITIDPTTNTISATGGASITVDSSLSTTSENPVQNKVITKAINTAQYTADDAVAKNTEQDSSIEGIINKFDNYLKIDDLLNKVYPVGAIYLSVNVTSPASLFGGTWEQIKDRFLLASGNTYTAGTTGGEATHTLTINEMPSHRHRVYSSSGYSADSIGLGNSNGKYMCCTLNGGNVGYYDTTKTGSNALENTGGSKAHNNMPPYLAVYMWKRTA